MQEKREENGSILASQVVTPWYTQAFSPLQTLSLQNFQGGRRSRALQKSQRNPTKYKHLISNLSSPPFAKALVQYLQASERILSNPDRWQQSGAQRPRSCRVGAAKRGKTESVEQQISVENLLQVCQPRGPSGRVSWRVEFSRSWAQTWAFFWALI